MPAWWSANLGDFLAREPESIVGALSTRLVETHPLNRATQVQAWRDQIALLREVLPGLPATCRLLLEYPLLRLQRRIDAVLLTDRAVLVLEFKTGAYQFTTIDRQQVEDYALDLFDFHAESRAHPVVPILIAAHATSRATNWPLLWHGVTPVLDASASTLSDLLREIERRVPIPARSLDPPAWETAPYRPVPTIVEAATMLYGRHGVAEIASARADVGNLTRTTEAIRATIDHARAANQHDVVFVTGIPGAGKTLCGLQVVFGANSGAAFLTGNLPLVHVMREALARDARDQGRSIRLARQETESAIQPLIGFLRDNLARTTPPHEHVIVFDEAQRAWNADFGRRKFGHAQSEAAMFLDIMRRHADWAVIVALVGGGQEINTGEAGLAAWGEALLEDRDWHVRAAPGVLTATDARQLLFAVAPEGLTIDAGLHLDVPIRSIRSAFAAPWVDAVLLGDAARARAIADEAGDVPFLLTRSLVAMRAALRRLARGARRAGLVCSASARRLIADGIWPNFPHLDDAAVANWFLQRWPDVRASDALELPATQFACQGLELDHVGLCWGNDLIRRPGRADWVVRNFAGTRWQEPRGEAAIAYQVNTYRVLLTRARYETVIWVPGGEAVDVTRPPAEFDAIADFLQECGAQQLEAGAITLDEIAEPAPMLL
ncbi:MAG TPA: DNA/RNA helicase domain-containing protein [Acetobacteraceae bacterium]|nr:DNA/RNA helicase domain-containing protein [Acetobacteraceae bacterium]